MDGKNNAVLNQAADLIIAQQKALDECAKQLADIAARLPKEGEWIKCGRLEGKTVLKCSVCSQGITDMFAPEYHYCPNCGARMKGEQE